MRGSKSCGKSGLRLRKIETRRAYWRRPRSPRTCSPLNSFQSPGVLGLFGFRGVRYSVLWRSGFADRDIALPDREHDLSA